MCKACLAMIGLTALAAAAAPASTARGAEFSADAFEARPGYGIRAGRIYVSGTSHRFDYQSHGMPISEINLPDQGLRRFVFPLTRSYVEQQLPPVPQGGTPCPPEPGTTCVKAGDGEAAGFATEIWVIKSERGAGETRVWWDKVRQLALRATYADGRTLETRRAGEETYDGRKVERWQISYRLPNGQSFPGEALFDPALSTAIAERRSDGGRRHLVNITVAPVDKSSFEVPPGYTKLPDPHAMRNEAAGAAAAAPGGRQLSPIARPSVPMPAPGPAIAPNAAPAPIAPTTGPAAPAAPAKAPEAAKPSTAPNPAVPADAKPAEAGKLAPDAPALKQPAAAPAVVPAEKIIERATPLAPLQLLQPSAPATVRDGVVAAARTPAPAVEVTGALAAPTVVKGADRTDTVSAVTPPAVAEANGAPARVIAGHGADVPLTATREAPIAAETVAAMPPLPVAKPAEAAALFNAAATAAAATAAAASVSGEKATKAARGKTPATPAQVRTKSGAAKPKPGSSPVPNPSGIPTLSALPPATDGGATSAAKISGASAKTGKQRKRTAKSNGSNRSKKGRRKAR
ncbi:MAG: hypothetical protein ACK4MF_01590 [Hyphomicrobiaceae bacterium]